MKKEKIDKNKNISYKIVTITEKILVNPNYTGNKIYLYINCIYRLFRFYFLTKLKINKSGRRQEKLDIFNDLFKELYYLNIICKEYNIKSLSKINHSGTNISITEIIYEDIRIYIEENNNNITSQIISTNYPPVNITMDGISHKQGYEILVHTLNIMLNDIFIVLLRYILYKKGKGKTNV